MTKSLPRSVIAQLASGALLAAAALSLAACETTGLGTVVPTAQAAPATAPASSPTQTTQAKPAAAEPHGPMTHREAALYCWMKTEHGRAGLSLDKRADVVDKCIKEKMQGN